MDLGFKDFQYPVELEFISVDKDLLTLIYFSIVERKTYYIQTIINVTAKLTIGMAPYGGVAFWNTEKRKNALIKWDKAKEINYPESKILNASTDTPSYNLFNNYMKQFCYRYLPLFDKRNKNENSELNNYKDEVEEFIPTLKYIEESLFDGTYDKLHDDGLLKYHEAGKPKKLAINWHIKKTEYSAYFWFEDEKICSIFERFYGAHPEIKTDFIIHIDAENKKYELALFRQGLKEPHIIPEDAYQLLVFKNKFEDYRSENYNQERGAWIW